MAEFLDFEDSVMQTRDKCLMFAPIKLKVNQRLITGAYMLLDYAVQNNVNIDRMDRNDLLDRIKTYVLSSEAKGKFVLLEKVNWDLSLLDACRKFCAYIQPSYTDADNEDFMPEYKLTLTRLQKTITTKILSSQRFKRNIRNGLLYSVSLVFLAIVILWTLKLF